VTYAHGQLRSFVDRVLRLKREQDDLAADIKEVYAEAKASGFDKTAMGQLVAHLRKLSKDPRKFEANSTLFETYLEAYEHGTDLATRAHAHEAEDKVRLTVTVDDEVARRLGMDEPDPPHDPSTGELIDDVPANGPVTRRLDDLGSVQDGLKMSTDGQPKTGLSTDCIERPIEARVTAGETAPLSPSVPLPPVETEAPGDIAPLVDAPGAPIPGEMPDIPAFLDRRRISEAAA
jgi:uncharacterized protein (UPF0335 family)